MLTNPMVAVLQRTLGPKDKNTHLPLLNYRGELHGKVLLNCKCMKVGDRKRSKQYLRGSQNFHKYTFTHSKLNDQNYDARQRCKQAAGASATFSSM